MTVPTLTASPLRLLTPVTGKIHNDGAAFVPLSPHKGVRNASIIYEAIKFMPDRTLIRGDFDKKSRPMIYFPERPPKKIGTMDAHTVEAKNISHDRAEFVSFMRSIIEAAYKAAPVRSPQLQAAIDLRNKTQEVVTADRDFSVGDIRKPLRSIAKAYNREHLKQLTSPHRTQKSLDPALQAKRIKQFVTIKKSVSDKLCAEFARDSAGKMNAQQAFAAVEAMRALLLRFYVAHATENLSFDDFLPRQSISRAVFQFAWRWVNLRAPGHQTQNKFSPESWFPELDRICPLIVKEYQSARRLRHQCGSVDDWSLASRRSVSTASDSSGSEPPGKTPRVMKRPKARITVTSHHESGTAMAQDRSAPASVLMRQASMPLMRERSRSDVSVAGTKKSSDPQISFIDAEAEIRTVIYYSSLDVSGSIPELSFADRGVEKAAKANAVEATSVSEGHSRMPDDSNRADVFSQEDQ